MAGKGGAIFRFTRHLNPKWFRVVALHKPTEVETGQWYFQRYIKHLPDPGEIVFFDRSWYNRAVVEPVMNFCNKHQYGLFMKQVSEIENMLTDDGMRVFKFWFSIDIDEQKQRLERRRKDPLRQWKLSEVDALAQQHWDTFTRYKKQMFKHTHTKYCPWVIIRGNNKPMARLESIRYVLSKCDYEGKGDTGVSLKNDPEVISVYNQK